MPTLPSALIRPTAPPDQAPEDVLDPELAEAGDGQGRGAAESRPLARTRRRRPTAPSDKTSKRGLYLTDSVWERLQLEAIRKRTNVSAIAGEFLERNLPRLRIERDV